MKETLNALLDAEADRLCNAQRYERSEARRDTRAGHYERKLHTKAGEVRLKIPKLRQQTFETAIIERYRRRESSVEEALIEMYLAGVSVRRVEDITEALWGTRVSPSTVSDLNKKIRVPCWIRVSSRARGRRLAQRFRSGGAGAQLWGLFGASRSKPLAEGSANYRAHRLGRRFRSGGAGAQLWGLFGASRSKPLAEGSHEETRSQRITRCEIMRAANDPPPRMRARAAPRQRGFDPAAPARSYGDCSARADRNPAGRGARLPLDPRFLACARAAPRPAVSIRRRRD